MKKILLIGGAGFIGLNISKRLSENPENKITIIDNFFRGKRDSYLIELEKKENVQVLEGDLTKLQSFDQLDKDFDNVYMLASVVGVEYTEKVPNEIIRINTQLIMNTLEWLKEAKCNKVLFTSTSECYAGAIESFNYEVPTNEEVPLTIQDISHPRFTYAVTKMLGESGFLNYAKVFGFEAVIVRYHNVYGPRMGFKHVIPQLVKRFYEGQNPFQIYGANQTRAFNYIDDAVSGTILAMENAKSSGEIFHIGDMRSEITIKELTQYIGSLMNFDGDYEQAHTQSGSVSRRCPDTSKAEKHLSYRPEKSWKDGVKETVEWYKDYYTNGGDIFE